MREDGLSRLMRGYRAALVDLGCGDGAFPYRLATAHPALLCIGLDPNREAMAEYARKARRKPARGGLANLLYVVAALESLPNELRGIAALITINFPWAGLLQHVVLAEPPLAAALHHLAAPSCLLEILLNADAEVAGLPELTPENLGSALTPVLARAGFAAPSVTWLPAAARVPSRWGGRLIKGSGRRTLRLRASRGSIAAECISVLDDAYGAPLPAGD